MARLKADSASGYRVAAVATLAAAVAGMTLLSGLLRLRIFDPGVSPLIAVEPLPRGDWTQSWLASAQTAEALQYAALQEWLRLVVAVLSIIMFLGAASALIALIAHATARRYEMALSAVVGATRAQLTQLQLRAAALNAALAVVTGSVIGLAAAYIANRSWPHVSTAMQPAGWLLLSTLCACALAAAVARVTAARMAHTGWMGDVLAPEARTNPGFGAEDLRGALLQIQFAFTCALLAVALLIQHDRVPGSRPASQVADVHVTRLAIQPQASPAQRRALHEQIKQAGYAIASPGVLTGAGESDHVLANCGRCSIANMMLPMFALRTQQHVVSAGFFAAAGHGVESGREFEPGDDAARHVVVNDTFANLAFQGQPAVGKTIQVGGLAGDWYTVIGVIADMPVNSLVSMAPDTRNLVRPRTPGRLAAIYFNAAEKPPAVFDAITAVPPTRMLAGVDVVWTRSLHELLIGARAPAKWMGGMLGGLAAIAVLIALLSMAALTLLNVRQRRSEIAARRAVGARRRDIVALVLGNILQTAGRGAFAGVILSIAGARAVQVLLPGMPLIDAGVLGVTLLLLTVVALVAALLPARAAALLPPAQIHS